MLAKSGCVINSRFRLAAYQHIGFVWKTPCIESKLYNGEQDHGSRWVHGGLVRVTLAGISILTSRNLERRAFADGKGYRNRCKYPGSWCRRCMGGLHVLERASIACFRNQIIFATTTLCGIRPKLFNNRRRELDSLVVRFDLRFVELFRIYRAK